MHDLARLLDGASLVAERHSNHHRKDIEASPYTDHPITIARMLAVDAGVYDVHVLMAAALHDVIEDTEAPLDDLRLRLGSRIADFMAELTDDNSLSRTERKARQIEHAPFKSAGAKLIKLADKTCNL